MIGFGDFDVIAEDVVEADFQRADAGAGALALLDLGEVGVAVVRDVAEFVETRVEAVADRAAVVEVDGRFVGEGGQNVVADFGDFIEALGQIEEARRFRRRQAPLQRWDDGERASQRGEIARAGGRQS